MPIGYQPRIRAERLTDEPIVRPGAVPGYGPIFNAGVIRQDGVFHLFARGVRDSYARNAGDDGPRFLGYVSDVLVFTSADGIGYTFQQVLATAEGEGAYGIEDPRVQRVESGGTEHVMMTYTHLPQPASGKPWRVGVHRLVYEDGRFALNRTSGRVVGPEEREDKDAVIFNLRDGRIALLHRLHPDMQLALFDSLEDLYAAGGDYWDAHVRDLERHVLIRPANGALGVGAGAPPVAVDEGLLLFYHQRDASSTYTLNVALLDPDTARVLAVLPEPIMRPELEWERRGDVDGVVFVQGAVPMPDGTIYLTYGAADRCVGAASVRTRDLVDALVAAA